MNHPAHDFDYIVVGSGAGGGVLAARLARNNNNLKVLLIDAGGEHADNIHSRVPGFHAISTEDPALRWDYFVQHFSDPAIARKDALWRQRKAIYYPRASALGGCTRHHAMLTVYPDRSDWDSIAQVTGDTSWSADNMWKYFERCALDNERSWLPVALPDRATIAEGVRDRSLRTIMLAGIKALRASSSFLFDLSKLLVDLGAIQRCGEYFDASSIRESDPWRRRASATKHFWRSSTPIRIYATE